MRNIPNTNGSACPGETPGQDGNLATFFTRPNDIKELIYKANSVDIQLVFRYYGLQLNQENRKCVCPFPFHKNGKENTASFWYYPETNTFFCFGCKAASRCCDLVSSMENISKPQAAQKILDLFNGTLEDDSFSFEEKESYSQMSSEKLEILLELSNSVRTFRQTHLDEKAYCFIEKLCNICDDLIFKHKDKLDNEALKKIINKLIVQINYYSE